ncbi:hypothetical protein IPH92_00855 [Candidatus Kaiserbacteria bacterium]|nr:MAG: hypothetical protein IPH92_00855 [Candidatus Kaiserbacteria bacterium]
MTYSVAVAKADGTVWQYTSTSRELLHTRANAGQSVVLAIPQEGWGNGQWRTGVSRDLDQAISEPVRFTPCSTYYGFFKYEKKRGSCGGAASSKRIRARRRSNEYLEEWQPRNRLALRPTVSCRNRPYLRLMKQNKLKATELMLQIMQA